MSVFEKMTAIADNIRSLLGLTEKLGLDAMTENLETANTEVESQKNIIEQLRSVISEKAGKPLGGSIDDLIDGSITEVVSNATQIKPYKFYENSSLKKAIFPLATSVGKQAFKTCTSLTELNIPMVTSIDTYGFSECKALVKVNIPMVTSVSTSVFRDCFSLKEIDLPIITSIDSYAFYQCLILTAVILRSEKICTLANKDAFNLCYHINGSYSPNYNPDSAKDGYIYVPRALIEDYKVATNWATYATQFRALEDYTVDGTTTGELDESKI